jgi:ATP-dependent RNA helicase RhlE
VAIEGLPSRPSQWRNPFPYRVILKTDTAPAYPGRRPRRRSRSSSARHRPAGARPPQHDTVEPTDDGAAASVPFESLGLSPVLLAGVAERGFVGTTPIQTLVIPAAREGRDLIACAETGTGKTAAFVLPILERLVQRRQAAEAGAGQRTTVLILTPTRELAVQIDDDIQGFAYHTKVSSVAVYGGAPADPQERALRAGVDIVVATPGRLMDHMRSNVPDFSGLDVLVLDEADRMMDMGFWPDITRIVGDLPAERQTLLFSATMPGDVMARARAITRDARVIENGAHNGPARTITHTVERMAATEKAVWLAKFLRQEEGPVLVFVRTKRGADRLATRLLAAGIRTAALHADRTQGQRMAAVEGLKSGRFTAIVATDVAARGLDIEAISHVVNYEVPTTREAYVHRVGRTGRAHATGTAVTLVAPEERKALDALSRELGIGFAALPA